MPAVPNETRPQLWHHRHHSHPATFYAATVGIRSFVATSAPRACSLLNSRCEAAAVSSNTQPFTIQDSCLPIPAWRDDTQPSFARQEYVYVRITIVQPHVSVVQHRPRHPQHGRLHRQPAHRRLPLSGVPARLDGDRMGAATDDAAGAPVSHATILPEI